PHLLRTPLPLPPSSTPFPYTTLFRSVPKRNHCQQDPHPPERNSSYLQFELRQFREVACPGVYLAALQVAKPIKAELFDGEATQHRTVNHGAAQRGVTLILTTRQVAHEATSKAVACSGRIVRLFEVKRRDAEDPAFVHHHGAVL